jgi:hypothetical protein
MNTNYIKHLKSFILSPIFPVLLGITIVILYIIYCTPAILCDDTLDLKDKLDFEIWKLEENRLNIEDKKLALSNLDLVTSKNTNGGFIHKKVWTSQLEKLFNNQEILLNNIHYLDNYIKKLEPHFSSKFDAAWQLKWGIIPKRN